MKQGLFLLVGHDPKFFMVESGTILYNKSLMRALKSFLLMAFFVCATAAQAEIKLQTLDGEEISLSSLKGKWVFINYWASWCGPCLDEIAALNQFYKNNKDRPVEIFAVNYDTLPLSKQQRLIKKFDIHYPSLKHSTAKALHLGGISVVPVTFVLNPQGELSTTLYGGQTTASLREAMSLSLDKATCENTQSKCLSQDSMLRRH